MKDKNYDYDVFNKLELQQTISNLFSHKNHHEFH